VRIRNEGLAKWQDKYQPFDRRSLQANLPDMLAKSKRQAVAVVQGVSSFTVVLKGGNDDLPAISHPRNSLRDPGDCQLDSRPYRMDDPDAGRGGDL